MKKIWGFGVVALWSGLGLTQLACSGGAQGSTEPEQVDPKMDELIGSVPVSSASLDGIGSIGYVYEFGAGGAPSSGGAPAGGAPASGGFASGGFASSGAPPLAAGAGGAGAGAGGASAGAGGACPGCQTSFTALCTATLVSKNSVLTTRSCAAFFEQPYYYYQQRLKFAIGADSTQPKRLVDVVAVEYAPASQVDGGSPDIAVLHLGESVTDVAPFPVAPLTNDLIGKQLAGVGYGTSDLAYASGTRRAGAMTLRATSGPLYSAVFGSFDAFFDYVQNNGLFAYPPYGGSAGAGGGSAAGAGGGSAAGTGAIAGEAGSVEGGGDDWFRQYVQSQYDNTLLGAGESYFGGTDADAQPCNVDVGGPVVRKLQGKVRVFGVFSHTPFVNCTHGAVYASITSATKAFIDSAAQWKDPCTGLTSNGSCVGNVATRCSTFAEGTRRTVKFDCSLLDQACVGGGTTEVACTDK